ncbi:hypothetical protein PISMIDRAFT_25615 [Pisolithus microcarpus 441]|uniref:Uncharacterized protein n=1 Tax=Pisolithus microcarpus 441 TaxID=765257 RepID=A0A0C9YRL1_9AGAM|nr:hypothetical protein BKA83DRAFT_25615 [Pisolithus microcarpus]KIK12942.1 hypothetical protein PISMIDRAFT_25615 [Pisolithus microcarpus 441]
MVLILPPSASSEPEKKGNFQPHSHYFIPLHYGCPYACLNLPTAKTAKLGKSQSVFLNEQCSLCPLAALHNMAKATLAAASGPLFSWRDSAGTPQPMGWGTHFGHSFQISRAPFFLSQKVNPEVVRITGRWKSLAYQLYIQAFKQIALVNTVPASKATTVGVWHVAGLQPQGVSHGSFLGMVNPPEQPWGPGGTWKTYPNLDKFPQIYIPDYFVPRNLHLPVAVNYERLKMSENPAALPSIQSDSTGQLSQVEMEQKQCKLTSMWKAIRSWHFAVQEECDASKLPMELDGMTPSLPNTCNNSEVAEVKDALKKGMMPTPVTKHKSGRQAWKSVDSSRDTTASSSNEDSDPDSDGDSDNGINISNHVQSSPLPLSAKKVLVLQQHLAGVTKQLHLTVGKNANLLHTLTNMNRNINPNTLLLVMKSIHVHHASTLTS